jgi:predicted DsbA family dithiol-disulfide isomerase
MSGRAAKRRRREASVAAAQRPRHKGRVPSSSIRGGTSRTARRQRQLLLSVGAAIVIAAILIGIGLLRGGSGSAKFTGLRGKAEVIARFRGIPQQGLALGSPSAPVTVEIFADPQCPYCGDFSRDVLPSVVTKYVRTGKVRLLFQGQAFVGPDSERALRLIVAAMRQNKLWQVADLLYANQGAENAGWVSEPLLRAIAAAVPGLNAKRVLADRQSSWVTQQMARSQARWQQTPLDSQGSHHTPYFMMGRTGSKLQPFDPPPPVDFAEFRAAVDGLLR